MSSKRSRQEDAADEAPLDTPEKRRKLEDAATLASDAGLDTQTDAVTAPRSDAATAAGTTANAEPGGGAGRAAAGEAANGYVSEEEDDEPVLRSTYSSKSNVKKGSECPYLDTVSRQNLDFDFEKCCSVSLSPVNVYACLVCGKYFQGRGPKTHAYTHSLEEGHQMFIKLENGKVFCLPEGYEVVERSLDDIKYVLNPTFTAKEVSRLDKDVSWARTLDGSEYMPGLVGLNDINCNDYANVIIQMLARVVPLRDFFLVAANYASSRSLLVQRFGELMRKLWNPRNFKGQVSPHEFMQAVMSASGKRFTIEKQSDPVDFFSWLLNTLHLGLTNNKRKKASIITRCFQGELQITTEAGTEAGTTSTEPEGLPVDSEDLPVNAKDGMLKRNHACHDSPANSAGKAMKEDGSPLEQDLVEKVPVLMLTMDLPPAPLYKDALERNIIPQVPIFEILHKYDGTRVEDNIKLGRRRFQFTRLPRFMAMHMKRFTKNNFYIEKNPTIVNFPVRNLQLRDVVPLPTDAKGEAVASKYDLLANSVHDGKAGEGTHRLHVHRLVEDSWYEVQDLRVTDILPQMVALSESYMQLYELRQQ